MFLGLNPGGSCEIKSFSYNMYVHTISPVYVIIVNLISSFQVSNH